MLLTQDDAAGEIDWTVSVGSTINRAHQHGTNRPARVDGEGDNDAAEADENGLPGGVGLAEAIEANGQRATGNGQRATGNGQRATGNDIIRRARDSPAAFGVAAIDRETLLLYAWADLTYEGIASAMEVPVEARAGLSSSSSTRCQRN